LEHAVRAAESRTFWTAGSKSAIKMPMMAITTSSSIRVKPPRFLPFNRRIDLSFREIDEGKTGCQAPTTPAGYTQ
jgi:hypothetical protein